MTKLDQHVNEMMTTAGKKFQIFLWSRFLIIMQNVNMVANGKRNNRLNPSCVLLKRCPGEACDPGKWGGATIECVV